MLKVTVEKIVDKLTEYGMALYTDYPTKDQGHCFMVRDMIIFLSFSFLIRSNTGVKSRTRSSILISKPRVP